MAKTKYTGLFETDFFEVADYERRAWEVFDGRTVIVKIDSSKRPRPAAQNRAEKRKAFDVLMECDLSNDPIKFAARELLGWVEVFDLTRERRDIAVKAASGDREAWKTKREAWKHELAESAFGFVFQILPATPGSGTADAERAELVREVKWLDGNLRSLEKQIVSLGRKNVLSAFEADALKGRAQHEGWKKFLRAKARNEKETKRAFFKLYRKCKGKSQLQRIKNAQRDFTEAFREENAERDVRDKITTPSRSTVYAWLEAEAEKRCRHVP